MTHPDYGEKKRQDRAWTASKPHSPLPLRSALIYALFGSAWIVLSDIAVDYLVTTESSIIIAQTVKGLLFIAATTALVYVLVRQTKLSVERADAADHLEATREMLDRVLTCMGEAVIIVDPAERTIVQVNPPAERIFGYSARELVGQRTRQLHVNEDTYIEFDRISRAALERGDVFSGPYTLRRKSGDEFHVEITVSPLNKQLGWEHGVLSIIRDVSERWEAEAAREQSELRYHRLVQALPAAIYECDRDGRIVFFNEAAKRLWGRDPESGDRLSGTAIMYRPDGSTLPVDACPMALTLATGRFATNEEIIVERPDGSQSTVLVNTLPMEYEGARVVRVLNHILDITAQKAAAEAVRNAEKISLDHLAHLQQLIEQIPDTIFVKDRDLRYRLANQACLEAMGCDEDTVIGQTDFEIFPPDTAYRIRDDDERVMSSGGVDTYEEQVHNHLGEMRTMLTTKVLLYDSQNEINGLCGIARDITEPMLLREALQERIKELRLLYEVTQIISQAETALEDALRQIVGRIPEGWLYPGDTGARITLGDKVYATENFAETEWTISAEIVRSGKTTGSVTVAVLGEKPERDSGPFLNEERELLETIAAIVGDAIERERLRQQYMQAQKLESVGRLAGGVSHDFNNALSVILGYTQMTMAQLDSSGALYADLREVCRATEHAMGLTRQLLAFSRQEIIDPVVLDLNDTVSSMVNMLKRLVTEDIALEWRPSEDPCVVKIDPHQLQQALANLVVNARDAIQGTGTITVAIEITHADGDGFMDADLETGEYAMLSVCDTGTGMSPEVREHIFEPFFTTKGKSEGTGLGLATVYGIVRQNGGAINVYSEVGEGTCFRLYLPTQSREALTPGKIEQVQSEVGGAETILLVEDDEILLGLTARIARSLGYTVIPANSPQEALDWVNSHDEDVHLIITDIVMPEMNGLELFDAIARVRPGSKCLFVSGYTADIIAKRGVLEKDVSFLSKPFTRIALASKIRETLDS